MKKAFVFLAEGFEEAEATVTIDVLRRGEIETIVVSITGNHEVTGAHGLTLVADKLFVKTDFTDADALVLPGGMPGSNNLNACEPLKKLLLKQFNDKKLIAAICAAPIVLGDLGILKGKRVVCYPGFESRLTGAIITDGIVAVDDNVITGVGPGMAFRFALAIVEALKGKTKEEEIADGLLLL